MAAHPKQRQSQLTDLLESSGARLRLPVDLEAPLPESGQILQDRFRIDSFLGSGGMGLVFQGKDLQTDASIVIKTLRPGATHQELQRFVKEAGLKLPEHPNIVKSIAQFVSASRPYYVQETVEGHNLADILYSRQEGRSSHNPHEQGWFESSHADRRAVFAAAQVADALQELHNQGIIHRDIKPSNLVWSPDEHAVIIDFGLALNEEDQSKSKIGNVVGTSAYLAPEILNGKVADGRSDIYSLAATLWQLLTGVPPVGLPKEGVFFGSDQPIDMHLLSILQTALEPNRRFRYATASLFAAALRGWLKENDSPFTKKSSVSIRHWLYFKRFEIALCTSILAVSVSILLGLYLFNYQVNQEAQRQGEVKTNASLALDRQNDYFGREAVDDTNLVHEILGNYLALLASGAELTKGEIHDIREDAFEIGMRTASFEAMEPFLSSRLKLEWDSFRDAHIDASIYCGLGLFKEATTVLREAAIRFPERREVADSAIKILGYFASSIPVEFQPSGVLKRSDFPPTPILKSEGTVQVLQVSDKGVSSLDSISSQGAFPSGRVLAACSVRGLQGEMGKMYFLDPRGDPRNAATTESGIFWQPNGSSKPPVLVLASTVHIGLSEGLGFIPFDIDGDGQEEVFAPFANSAAQSFLMKLENDEWVVKGLPGKGGDVHGLHIFQADGQRQLAVATSHWNEKHQGYRIRTYDFSPSSLTLTAGMNLPLGAIQSWELLRGWPAHSVATFDWMDESQFFGGRFRRARAGEIWLLNADVAKGIVPFRRLDGTPIPKAIGEGTSRAIPMDLDQDGRDEIYWAWVLKEKVCLTVFLNDSNGEVFSLPLGIGQQKFPVPYQGQDGAPGLFFLGTERSHSLGFLVRGTPGFRDIASSDPLPYQARRIFTVRGEGAVLEGDFSIPLEWKPGDSATWFEADLRLIHPDFDSFAFLALEMRDTSGVLVRPDLSLAMRVVGGGDVYDHRLGAMTSVGFDSMSTDIEPPIQLIPGGWVHVTIGPSINGEELQCILVPEEGTPGAPQRSKFNIQMKPRPGAVVHWDWRSSPPGNVAEARDETAVLAWDWLGPGTLPKASFAHSDDIKKAFAFGESLIHALENEDRGAFGKAKRGLNEIMGGPRVAIPSEQRQNSLARYYLEEYGSLFLE